MSIRLRIGDRQLLVCLDTGASNILPRETFADGDRLDIGIQLPDVPIFTGASDALMQWGIHGLLAPQSLAIPDHHVLIDLPQGTIAQVPDRDVLGVLGVYPARALSPLNVRRCDMPAGEPARFVVEVMLGGQATPLLVDTGAANTILWAGSPAATRLAKQVGASPRGRVQRWNRTTQVEVLDREVVLLAGDAHRMMRPLIEHDPPVSIPDCGYQGALGLDFLRHCMLVTNATNMHASCQNDWRTSG